MAYTPVTWVDGVTPVNAAKLNQMEDGIEALDARPAIPTVVNGQWIKGVGGVPVWSAIAISDVATLQAALDAKQASAQKGAANGYAGLDGSSLIADANIPAAITRDSEVLLASQLLGAKAQQATPQSLINNTLTTLTNLATVVYDDTGSIVSGGTMVIPDTGRYIIGCYVVFAATSAVGARSYFLKIDTATLVTMRQQAPTTGSTRLLGETVHQCTAGQVVAVDAIQDSGANLDVSEYKLWIQRIK